MKLTKQILFPSLLLALTACTTVATSSPEVVYVEEEVVVEEEYFSQAELDQMLAPIALYPDVLLSQVLMAATYPLEIVEAGRWSLQNPDLAGDEAVLAVEGFNWDISVKTLVAFPDLIQLMDENLTWTRQLGDAFLMQEGQVMDTVQQLRQRSLDAGSLASLEHVRVEREEEIIIIEPADVRVVYVPYYRPTIVYGDWWWYDYPPYYWDPPRRYYTSVGFHWGRGFHWSTGFHISTRFYYSFCDWHRRSIVVHHHHHHYDRHDWDRVHHRPHPSQNAQVWKHNPHHRRGVEYRSDELRTRHPRHSSTGRSDQPILARPNTNRGTAQANPVGQGTRRLERPERPGLGGTGDANRPTSRVSPPPSERNVGANRSARVSSTQANTAPARTAPASRTQSARITSSDQPRSSATTRVAPRPNSSTRETVASRSTTSTSRPSSVTRSSSANSRPPSVSRSSTATSRPPAVSRSSSSSSRQPSVSRSSSSRPSQQARVSSSRSSSRPSSVAPRSSGGSTRSAPQARSSSSRSSGSSQSARAPSSSRSTQPAARSSNYSSRSSSSSSSGSRATASNDSSYNRPRSSPR